MSELIVYLFTKSVHFNKYNAIGSDFGDGVIRNKLIATDDRRSLVLTYCIVSSVASVCCFALVTLFSAGIGQLVFENNIRISIFVEYLFVGMLMTVAFACLHSMTTIIIGNKTSAVIVSMGSSFCMLLLSMRLNSILVQDVYKNGTLNPNYVGGIRRVLYLMIQDINPYGQAAQLSSWNIINPARCIVCSLIVIMVSVIISCVFFVRKDIK